MRVECDYNAWKNEKFKSVKESFSYEYFKFNDACYPLRASYTESIRTRNATSADSVITKFSRHWEVLNVTNGNFKMPDLDNLNNKVASYDSLKNYQKHIFKMQLHKKKAPFIKSHFR